MVAKEIFILSESHEYVAKPSEHKKCRVKTIKSPEVKFILATSHLRKQNIFISDVRPVILRDRSAEPDLF